MLRRVMRHGVAAVTAIILFVGVSSCGDSTGVDDTTTGDGGKNNVELAWASQYQHSGQARLNGIWGAARNDIYAAGAGGTVLHYDGGSWAEMAFPSATDLMSIWGTVGSFAEVSTTDPGVSIVSVGQNLAAGSYAIVISTQAEQATVDAVAVQSAPLASSEFLEINGTTIPLNAGMDRFAVKDLVNQFRAVTGAVMVFAPDLRLRIVSEAYGAKEKARVSSSLPASPTSTGFGTAEQLDAGVDIAGTIGGHAATGLGVRLLGVPGTPVAGLAVEVSGLGAVGTVVVTLKTHDFRAVGLSGTIQQFNGTGWSPSDGGTSNHLFDVWGITRDNMLVVGGSGTILSFDRVISPTWNAQTTPTFATLRGVWCSSPTDAFVVGDAGTILHYDGMTWSSMSSNTTHDLSALWGTSPSNIVAVGSGGNIMRYNGATWSPMQGVTVNDLFDVWASVSDDMFAVGARGTIMHFDGSEWSAQDSGTSVAIRSIWGSSDSNVYAAGDDGLILHYGPK